MAQRDLAYSNSLQCVQSIIQIFPKDMTHEQLDLNSLSKREKDHLKECVFQLFINCCCADNELCLSKIMHQIERALIMNALFRFNGSIAEAAGALGVKYTTLHEKIKRHQIQIKHKYIPHSSAEGPPLLR